MRRSEFDRGEGTRGETFTGFIEGQGGEIGHRWLGSENQGKFRQLNRHCEKR